MNESTNVAPDLKNDLIPQLKVIGSRESKIGSLTLLIVTIVIFFSTGIISAKWQEILILIGVLLFHELGHLAAMKLMKYNDVKMFFIPFLGAAVSGKSQNDTAAKSCIVSLMGPFPGIIFGIILFFMFALTKNYYLYKAAEVMLVLNAFNFLPIMPLDGGRCIDVLFINRKYFRLFFTLIGAAVFLLLAVLAEDIVIGLLGGLTVYIAIANFKLHGIANDLRSQNIRAASVNDLMEDESSMQVVIDKLKARYPKMFSPQISHQGIFNQLTAIVDTIKFVPARLFPKIILLALYLLLVLFSIVVSVGFLAANYKETTRIENIDGKQYVYMENHWFGKKAGECPINDALYYNGKGTVFGINGQITDVFYYANGYRTGEWLKYSDAKELLEKKTYDRGRLLSVSQLENGKWKTYKYEDFSFLRRCIEEIQRISQPFKSNHKYFEK